MAPLVIIVTVPLLALVVSNVTIDAPTVFPSLTSTLPATVTAGPVAPGTVPTTRSVLPIAVYASATGAALGVSGLGAAAGSLKGRVRAPDAPLALKAPDVRSVSPGSTTPSLSRSMNGVSPWVPAMLIAMCPLVYGLRLAYSTHGLFDAKSHPRRALKRPANVLYGLTPRITRGPFSSESPCRDARVM